jgi:biopolymer transport protein ExbD
MSVRLDHGKDELEDIHEINVTPFIDVILVLLIIFMIAAPLATVDINVNLPGLTANPQKRPDKPIFLTIKADHSLALGDNPVSRDSLASALTA